MRCRGALRGDIIIIGDIDGVVGDGRLGFREEQVQFVGKKGNEEQQVLAALALLEEVIFGPASVETAGKSRRGLNYRIHSFGN